MCTEFSIRILASERPLDRFLLDVASPLPRVNLALQAVSTFNPLIQALTTECVLRFIVTAHSGIVTSDSGHRDRGVDHRFRQRDRRFR